MMFRLLVLVLALALMPTSLIAGPRAVVAGSLPAADGSENAVMRSSGKTGGAEELLSAKRCKRGALPACGADLGLPVNILPATATATGVRYDSASPTMTGVSPGCLVGPPRPC